MRRFGKVIGHVNLHLSQGFQSARKGVLADHAILLRAIAAVPKRANPEAPTTPALDFR